MLRWHAAITLSPFALHKRFSYSCSYSQACSAMQAQLSLKVSRKGEVIGYTGGARVAAQARKRNLETRFRMQTEREKSGTN